MNQPLTTAELERLAVPAPIVLSKKDKLLRLARVVRGADPKVPFLTYHRLEYMGEGIMRNTPVNVGYTTAFTAALGDPVLQDAGYAPSCLAEVKSFFELTQAELHEFSCDCARLTSNETMARRIEAIANKAGDAPPLAARRAANIFLRFLG